MRQQARDRDWVNSTLFDSHLEPEKSYERTAVLPRSKDDLLDGINVRELDIELDTIPAELLDLIERK